MSSVRKSVLFEEGLDFGSQGGNQPFRNPNANTASSFPSQSTFSGQSNFSGGMMDFIGGSDFVAGAASDYILQKGMDGIYGQINQYQSYLDVLRKYFDVDNNYVLRKMLLLMFPFKHKRWSTQGFDSFPSADQRDINEPDLYIPIMTLISYFLLVGAIMARKGDFRAETLGQFAFWKALFWIGEAVAVRIGFYIFGLDKLSLLDTFAYTGYKFVGILLTVILSVFGGAYVFWPLWIYTGICMSYFLVKTLRRAALRSDDPAMRINMETNTRTRNWFLFSICFLQLPLMFIFSFWSSGIFFA